MATKTNNLGLSKAELTDAVRSTLTANNGNFDIIDDQIARLKANQIVGTASGTEIVVEDSAEMESILKISGNSEQDSRSGKNLLKVVTPGDSLNYNSETEDYTVKSGFSKSTFSTIEMKLSANKTYLFEAFLSNGVLSNQGVTFMPKNSDGTNVFSKTFTFENSSNYYSYSYTATADVISTQLQIYVGTTLTEDVTFKIQMRESTTEEGYEPYGLMPSPDYPSEIRSVKSKSDNLFDKAMTGFLVNVEATQLEKGIRYTLTQDVNNATSGRAVYPVKDLSNDVGKTIRVKCNFISDTLSPLFQIGLCDQNGENRKQVGHATRVSGTELSFVVPTLTGSQTYLCVYLFATQEGAGKQGDYTDFTNIMVTIDSEIKNYQPYGYVPVEVKVEGKNLFDEVSLMGDYLTDGYYSFGDSTLKNIINPKIKAIKGFKTATQYTISLTGYFTTGTWIKFTFYYTDGTSKSKVFNENKEADYVFTSDAGKTIDYIELARTYWADGKVVFIKENTLQLEEGSTATPYTPHVEPNIVSLPLGDIELRSTPDGTRDTFERVDGVWNKVEKIYSEIFDGTKTSTKTTNAKAPYGYFFAHPLSKTAMYIYEDKVVGTMISTHFKTINNKADQLNFGCITMSTSKNKVSFFINEDITTVEQCNAWLSTNMPRITYVLETPTYTPITDTALIQALDTLEQLILHKGYNRITVTSVNGVKAYLDLSYIKDINSVLDNINAIILTLGGGANV